MRLYRPVFQTRRSETAFTLVEVVIATAILVIGYVGLYGAMAFGWTMVKNSRENLRATEIMTQKMEQIRLYDWQQVTDTSTYMKTAPFAQYYDPANTNKVPVYWCRMVVTTVPSTFSSSYRDDMRLVRVIVLWTNYYGGVERATHARTNETYVSHYGLVNYVYGN